jgi:hypothetical protein
VVSLKDIQRERGEIAIEGVGTMDSHAAEQPACIASTCAS